MGNIMAFAQFLEERRRLLGLTQREIAKNAGILQSTYNKYATGNASYLPDPDTFAKLAEALKTSQDAMLMAAGYKIGVGNDFNIAVRDFIIDTPLMDIIMTKYNIENRRFVEGIVELVESQVEIQQQRGSSTHRAVRDEE